MRFRNPALIAAAVLLCALVALRYWRQGASSYSPVSLSRPAEKRHAAPDPADARGATASERVPTLAGGKAAPESEETLAAFTEWTHRYLKADSKTRPELINEGVILAQARRPVFKALIQDDPRGAIEAAVPMVVRQQLPPIILAQLEDRVNRRADLRVYQGVPPPGEPLPTKTLTHRIAAIHDGPDYVANVYGKRALDLLGTRNDALNGVSIDNQFAVNEEPVRVLETGEKPDPGKVVVTACPVSGKEVVSADAAGDAVPSDTTAVETPEEVVYLCGGYHKSTYTSYLYAEGGTGGPIPITGILPAAPTPALGMVKVLYIPMTFADQNVTPAAEAKCYQVMRDVGDYYAKASFGKLTTITTVTPPIKLPHDEAWYIQKDTSNGGTVDGLGLEMTHSREEAKRLGFDFNDYDCTVLRMSGGARPAGGWGGGSTVWVYSDSVGVCAHEIGHSFGLAHANFWDTAGTSAIGAGTNAEYGDIYDVMGGGGVPVDHYNAQAKNQIKWLPSDFILNVAQSGTYRIYAFDQPILEPQNRYALRITKDSQRAYWGEVRQLYNGNSTRPWADKGLILGWRFPNGGASNIQLIDTTPGSAFSKDDAAISLGRTFSDFESGIHITTTNVSSTNPKYVDVVVNIGTFPANHPPTLSLAASAEVVPIGATVTFTATASDPDGDTLAYSWQNDTSVRIVSPNSPTITRTFPTAGSYLVACTVSDMKGGSAIRSKVITVGSGNSRYTISGRITDPNGNGIPNVTITANGANAVPTDSDGYYSIPNLVANTYTMTPLLYGYAFSETFNNSVTVGPGFTGANFVATQLPFVTIAATAPDAQEPGTGTAMVAGRFTLSRAGDISQDLVISVNAVSGTATKTTDYTFAPDYVTGSQGFSTFTIPADSATLDITVTPVSDSTVEGPETVILQLGPGSGYLVGGASQATVTINDDPADSTLPLVSVAATTPSTIENSGVPAVFTVSRTGSTGSALVVNYTIGGAAAAGADYTALSGSVTIPVGASMATVPVAPIDDSTVESVETVIVTLTASAGYLMQSGASTATVSIIDDDVPTVSVVATDASATEVDLSAPGAKPDTGTFLISRTGDTTQPLTVYYALSGPTTGEMALHGVDYEALPGVVVIPGGASSATVTIVPRWDNIGEGTEYVTLNLGAGPTNYKLGTANSDTIAINDAASNLPSVEVIGVTTASEPSTNGAFRITTRSPSVTPVVVNFTMSGTAQPTSDYTITNTSTVSFNPATQIGTLTITPSVTAPTFTTLTINIVNDSVAEELKTLTLTLDASSNYQTFAPTSSATIWVRDDDQPTVFVDPHTSNYPPSVAENGSAVAFYLSRTGATTSPLTVNYTVSGTATNGVDYDGGTGWNTQSSGTSAALAGVWGSSVSSVWAVGDTGVILRWDGTAWSAQSPGTAVNFHAIWGSDASNVWAVGDGGTILKWNGSAWSQQTSGATAALRGVWGSDAGNVWAVGDGGTILKWNGSAWAAQSSGIATALRAVWGTSATSVWAVGDSGVVQKWNGTAWAAQTSGTGNGLKAVWGSSATSVWAVGDIGTIIKFNGTAWSAQTSGTGNHLTAIWGSDASNVSATGAAGTILKTANGGTTWVAQTVNSVQGLNAIWGSDASNLWAVGNSGAIQNWNATISLPLSGVAVIPASAQGIDVTIRPIQDAIFEGTETIVLSLAPGAYGRGADALLYLTDDETSATQKVAFASASGAGSESVTTVNIPVTLTGNASSGAPVTVEYVVDSGSRSSSTATNNVETLPYWVRVTRSGSTFTYWQSNDGVNWTQRGSALTISMSTSSYLAGLAVTSGQSGVANDVVVDNVSVTGLSAGGSAGGKASLDVGSVSPAGSDSANSGTYSISAGGGGVNNASATDGFRFVYFPITNSSACTVTARIVSQSAGSATRAGVMFRETTATGAIYAGALSQLNGTYYVGFRTSTNANGSLTAYTTLVRPIWVRLQRAGNLFTASQSIDGSAWTTVGSPQTVALSPDVLAGLAVCSKSDGTLSTATFDNVSLTGSPTLVGRTVGYVNAQGSDSFASGVYTVTGSGAQIGGTEDECHFAAAPISGDFTLIARVTSQSGGAAAAQAGVMVRENGTYRVRSLYIGSVANAGTEFVSRTTSVTTSFGDGVDYSLGSGVLTFDADNQTKSITLNVIDDSIPEPDENVTLVLRNPTGAVLGATSVFTYTIIDNDTPPALPAVGFSAATSSAPENTGAATLTVVLASPATSSVKIDYAATGGSASPDVDYTLPGGTLTFAPGETVKSIPVALIDDAVVDPGETVVVTLSNPVGAILGSIDTHTLTIVDDEFPKVTIAATDPSAAETGDTGAFTITRAGSLSGGLTVNLTRTGTATSGNDFVALPASVTMPDGQSSVTLTVSPLQDTANEGTETVILTIAADPAYTVGSPNSATVNIADDDRSTVTIVANDPNASETSGDPGQFTVTRTAPTTGSLTVNLTISGTAINGTDYTSVVSTFAFAAGQSTRTIDILPIDDTVTEGPEQVTISIASGSYDIGAASFADVTIADNDVAPTLYVTEPTAQGNVIPSGQGVIVSAYVSDDGLPSPVSLTWSQASGPGTATFATPNAASTPVTFSADGVYVLRITATDGQFTVSDQVTVIVGSAIAPADWLAQDMSPSTQQRGQTAQIGGSYILTGMGAGYASTSNDAAHIMARQVTGDGSIVARLTSIGGAASAPLAGVTIRDSLARSCKRAVFGYVPGAGLQFRSRSSVSTNDSVTTQAGVSLPVWVKLDRVGNLITASYAPDVSGSPGSWNTVGAGTSIAMADATTQMGLTATGNSGIAGILCTATFDNVTLTPTPSGPALVSEDLGVGTPTASTFAVNNGVYTIGGSGSLDGSGAFYGWQYYGDLMVTAKLASASSSALSAKSGIMIRESMDSAAGYVHLGRIPQGAFSGYIWRSLAGGGGGGVPSFTGSVRWMRLIRQGNKVTAFHAADVSGSPGTWTQLGQPQTIIMSTPVLVGFAVDNSGGAAGVLNVCTFTNLSIVPLNSAPRIDLTNVPASAVGSANVAAAVTDDGNPAGTVTTTWSNVSGPGAVNFTDPSALNTTAGFPTVGAYTLRLQADDSEIITFRDKTLNYYESQFQQWQSANFAGNPESPNAAPDADPDGDGLNNLMEYALNLSPTSFDRASWAVDSESLSGASYLRLTVPKNPAATDVAYQVEATSDVTSAAVWSSNGLTIEQNSATTLQVRDSVPIGSAAHRFMRLKVSR